MCYDCKDIQAPSSPTSSSTNPDGSSIQATRLRKGKLIKVGDDLFRILDLHHLTPGNKRGHHAVPAAEYPDEDARDHKFRAEEDIERAMLDEHEMQYLYSDGDVVPLHGHVHVRADPHRSARCSATR